MKKSNANRFTSGNHALNRAMGIGTLVIPDQKTFDKYVQVFFDSLTSEQFALMKVLLESAKLNNFEVKIP